MATRGKSKKTSGGRSAGGSRTPSRKTSRSAQRQPTPAFELSLRPEHRRELFALALITIALVTLIFFVTGATGGVGNVYVQGVQQAFGGGALMIPLVLGVLGVAILIQERSQDAQLTGANVLGTFLILGMLLALIEFPRHEVMLAERSIEGGGLIGYTLVDLLDAAIGRPAAILIVVMTELVGVMLTFNITLRELLAGIATRASSFWLAIQRAPRRPAAAASPELPDEAELLAFTPPPGGSDDDIVPTPIAERPTRASLFQRANTDTQSTHTNAAPPQPAQDEQPARKAPATTPPKPDRTPDKEPAQPAAVVDVAHALETNIVEQQALEGFNVPSVRHTWPLPALDILEMPVEGGITDEERRVRARLIEETLASFKVEARVVGVNTGPAVTQFELQPAVGVKVSKITALERDLALALAAQSIRIEAPIPGKNVVGIEIPNSAISLVTIREVIDSDEYEASKGKLKLLLGKDTSGTPVIADMTRMPHLLVAGSTGSGKSVAINAFLCGLLFKHTPDELKLILVDPKMVELIVYNRIPHLLSPVVTELERVVPTLKWATREMERRYKIFARYACRNLESYNQIARRRSDLEPLPYILIVIDELADLMMLAPDEIETHICRLAQMARATGIHLIIATQRPSVDVITGLIKANFPSRIAFAVSSQVDSRVIIDTPGADRLLGRGDMLYMAPDSAKLVRIQGTYVSDREVEQVVSFWRDAAPPEAEAAHGEQKPAPNAAQPSETPETTAQPPADQGKGAAASASPLAIDAAEAEAFEPPAAYLTVEEQDALLPQALELVKHHQRASASLLQRRLRIGYSKAAQLIDLLEQQGVVGPAEGGRSREVLRDDE